MLILSAADLKKALPLEEAIRAMEETFRMAAGNAHVPARMQLPMTSRGGTVLVMPALAEGIEVCGTKIVSLIPGNPSVGLEPLQAFYALVSTTTGRLLSLMDGRYLTAARTAATSAVATRIMSRDSPVRLAIFGTGTQARFHLEAISLVRNVVEARVCGSGREKSEDFARSIRSLFSFPVEARCARESVAGADIVCTCTSSPHPVFEGAGLTRGTHINAIGAYRPETRELDDTTIGQARIVVDTIEGAMKEAGDILLPLESGLLRPEQVAGDLSQILRGSVPGRTSEEEITVFKSVGSALEDLGAGHRAYENARQLGLGREIEFQ